MSMATFAARRLQQMLRNTEYIVAIELLAAAQGIELKRGHARPMQSCALLEGEWSAIRAQVTFIEQDRYLAPDVERMRQWALRAPAAWPAPLAAVLGDA